MIFSNGVFNLSGEELLTSLKKVSYASQKRSDDVFSGVGLFINPWNIEIIASNNHRIAIYSIELDYENSDDIYDDLLDTNYPISKNTVNKLLKKVKKDDNISLKIDYDFVIFESKNFRIVEKTKGYYPHYFQTNIPSEYTNTIKLCKSDLIEALNQITYRPFKNEDVGNYTCLKLTFDSVNEKLIIKPYLTDLKFEINITIDDYYDDLIDIYINDKYLFEAISNIDDSVVKIKYIDNNKPIAIISDDNYEPYKAYIMTMATKGNF